MPLLRRKRVLAVKAEAVAGTAEALAAADAAINAFNVEITPTAEFQEREGQSAFSPLPGIVGAESGTATFTTELEPASGAHPFWALRLFPAVGLVATVDTYAPLTAGPGASVKTLTIGSYQDGVFKSIKGAMGTAVFRFVAGQKIEVDWTFTGIWVPPTDVAILAPTYPTLKPLRFVSSALAIGAFSPKVQQVTIDLGNQVILREDSASASGYSTALITGRRITGTVNPESELIATKNFHAEWLAETEQALNIVLREGNIGFTFNAPKMQFTGVQPGERNQMQIEELAFQCNRSAAAGDDELTVLVDHNPI